MSNSFCYMDDYFYLKLVSCRDKRLSLRVGGWSENPITQFSIEENEFGDQISEMVLLNKKDTQRLIDALQIRLLSLVETEDDESSLEPTGRSTKGLGRISENLQAMTTWNSFKDSKPRKDIRAFFIRKDPAEKRQLVKWSHYDSNIVETAISFIGEKGAATHYSIQCDHNWEWSYGEEIKGKQSSLETTGQVDVKG